MIKGLPIKLKELRKKYGYSQREVANRLRISTSVISAYENGERTPSAEILLALSYLYKCSTDYLLGKDQTPPETVLDTSGLTSNQIQILSDLIDSMRQ
ncbi:MAG: helix-turn-helix transcriptional regulator [Lachnospiraceae bacterium]|nr:helix-turn-helix transcriptional regulator [Lachnospiraceae bacterium]